MASAAQVPLAWQSHWQLFEQHALVVGLLGLIVFSSSFGC